MMDRAPAHPEPSESAARREGEVSKKSTGRDHRGRSHTERAPQYGRYGGRRRYLSHRSSRHRRGRKTHSESRSDSSRSRPPAGYDSRYCSRSPSRGPRSCRQPEKGERRRDKFPQYKHHESREATESGQCGPNNPLQLPDTQALDTHDGTLDEAHLPPAIHPEMPCVDRDNDEGSPTEHTRANLPPGARTLECRHPFRPPGSWVPGGNCKRGTPVRCADG